MAEELLAAVMTMLKHSIKLLLPSLISLYLAAGRIVPRVCMLQIRLGFARLGDLPTWCAAVGVHVPVFEASVLLSELLLGSKYWLQRHDADALFLC
ncbi:hypothetical protein Nepgr_027334 [Nepenthes gracilis]|uniref:Uncharacterized protein n=1 Tax=Nepenthes gracilis TaxID=150966 RepID=A0AAD3TB70_NEPGR|nr:hypothetical protein Nepgr_027334 [Nepenthes gracilis]